MANIARTSSGGTSRATYSCILCAERKVRCDRQRPCGACAKRNVTCVFNPSPPLRKRHKRTKEQALTERLKYYETLLEGQGVDPNQLQNEVTAGRTRTSNYNAPLQIAETQLQTPSSIDSESEKHLSKTQLFQTRGRSNIVDNNLWSRVAEELQHSDDTLEEFLADSSEPEASDDDSTFVLNGVGLSRSTMRHPPSEQILELWQIFIENVDPLTKAIHVPSLGPAIRKAASDVTKIPRGFQALMFSIYSMAIVSTTEGDCMEKFQESRVSLLSRYTAATKIALAHANFMATTNLVVLQALILHIFSVRSVCEARTVWSLTGVAVRIAQCIGLDRDGSSLGLPPFESELRRRVWWLLKTHDFQAAELCGLQKFRDLDTGPDSTRWPTNVNDDQIHPGMSLPVAESGAMTDFVFHALRYELTKLVADRVDRFREQGKGFDQWDLRASGRDKEEIEVAVNRLQERLETKYLRYCDPSQPLHLFVMLIARSATNHIAFLSNHPRKWPSVMQAPDEERCIVWNACIKFLEQYDMMSTNPKLKRFAWHAAYNMKWHCFIHVLDVLRADPKRAGASMAWQLVGKTFANMPEILADVRKPIHVAIGNLCLKSYSRREQELGDGGPATQVPWFIGQLRQQRSDAKASKAAYDARTKGAQATYQAKNVTTQILDRPSATSIDRVSTGPETADAHHSVVVELAGPVQTGSEEEKDPFWVLNGLNDNQLDDINDVMDLDPDFLLSHDYDMEGTSEQFIVWDQWDTWLAESNAMRPLPAW